MSQATETAAILAEVGDSDDGTLVNGTPRLIDTFWLRYADKAGTAPRLQELYTKRACIDALLAFYRQQVSFKSPDLSVSQNELTENLRSLRVETQDEIQRVETRARANRSAQGAVLATTAPEAPPTGWRGPDGNAPAYRGDLYRPGFPRTVR